MEHMICQFSRGSSWDCWPASLVANSSIKPAKALFSTLVLGIVGAVVGGFLFNRFEASGVTGLNIYSLFVAVIGAVLLLVAYHVIRRRNLAWYRR